MKQGDHVKVIGRVETKLPKPSRDDVCSPGQANVTYPEQSRARRQEGQTISTTQSQKQPC
jgi:hypothetical protein